MGAEILLSFISLSLHIAGRYRKKKLRIDINNSPGSAPLSHAKLYGGGHRESGPNDR